MTDAYPSFIPLALSKSYYQEIAPDYSRHRRIHPEVFQHLIADGPIRADSHVLEVGCGTGNYICMLSESLGCNCSGVDPSNRMLAQAKSRSSAVQFTRARAEDLPFAAGSFDLTFSVDVIHHVTDRMQAFRQAARVLRSSGRICIVTDSEEILRTRQPQSVYFPESIDVELSRYPAIALLKKDLIKVGFCDLAEKIVEHSTVLPSIEPFRAQVFSSLRLISQEAFARGMARLESDFQKGPIPWVSRYLMLWGRN